MSTGKRTEFLGHGKVRETTFFSNGAKTIRVKKRGVFFDKTLSIERRKGKRR
jgi:hypothetical protein